MAKELVLEVKENKLLRRRKVPMMGEWLYDEKSSHAWFTLRKLFAWIAGGDLGLVLDERYAIPLSPYRKEKYSQDELDERTDRKTRIKQAFNAMKTHATKQGQINVVNWTISLVVAATVFVFIVIALLLASGKVQI